MIEFKEYEIFRENIKKAMAAKSILSQKRLAEMAGLRPATLSEWLSGLKKPKLSSIERLASELGTTAIALLSKPEPEKPPAMDLSREVFIEIKGKVWATPFRISTGRGIGRYIKGKPGELDCFGLEVEGDSMAPIYMPGDVIICRPHKAVLSPYAENDEDAQFVPYDKMSQFNNRDVVVTFNGETNLKRIQLEKKQGPKYDIFMQSMNPKYPKVRVSFGDEWELQALVMRSEKPEFLEL